uniref:Uncharacterized protein n=1 Tax=Parascaris univalens TaxID=6257 RepID=A0A915AS55_PARUN
MGSCQSQEAQEQMARNKAIEKQLNQDKRAGSSIVKLLLLELEMPAKRKKINMLFERQDIVFLQILQIILHSNGFTEDEINERKAVVYNNTVTSIVAILRAMDNVLHIQLEDPEKEAEKALVYRVVEVGDESEPFTDEVANAIVSLWNDKGVRKAYDMRSEYQLNDSAKYFLDSVTRIHEPGYRPSEQDILYSRVATTGVVEVKFKIKELDFRRGLSSGAEEDEHDREDLKGKWRVLLLESSMVKEVREQGECLACYDQDNVMDN